MKAKINLIATILIVLFSINVRSQGSQNLSHEDSRFGIFDAYSANEYDFFIMQMGYTSYTQYWSWVNNHFGNINAHWTRSNMRLIWDEIEPVLDSAYNWSPQPFMTDSVIINVYKPGNQVHWLGVFNEGGLFDSAISLRDPLNDTVRFKMFVQSAVERYDGDGYQDANPYVKVKYWQVGNEYPLMDSSVQSLNKYISLLKVTSDAIHSADSTAKIVMIAAQQGYDLAPWVRAVLLALGNNNYFNVIDIHHWGFAPDYKMPAVSQARFLLDSIGMFQSQIWSCENGTWAYQPTNLPYQTQQQQARSLIQRYVYNIGLGLNKLFWNNLMEWNENGSIWSSIGLIGDGGGNGEPTQNFNKPRINYFSYKLLSQEIDIDKANYVGKMNIHQEPVLYAYQYTALESDSAAVFILWRDTNNQSVTFHISTLKAIVTNFITASLGNILQSDTIIADGQGNITFNVGIDPLLVKEIPNTISIDEKKNDIVIKVYPNPSNGKFIIKIKKVNGQTSGERSRTMENEVISIYNVFGEKVFQSEISNPQSEIDISAQSTGIYFYQVTNERQLIGNGKIVIQ